MIIERVARRTRIEIPKTTPARAPGLMLAGKFRTASVFEVESPLRAAVGIVLDGVNDVVVDVVFDVDVVVGVDVVVDVDVVVVCFVKVVELVLDSVVEIIGLFVANVVLDVEIEDVFVAGVVPARGPQGQRLVPVETCLTHFFFLVEYMHSLKQIN